MGKYLFPLSKRSYALIFVAAVINVMGRSLSMHYSVPFFLDSFGTFLAAVLLGPIAGAVTGILGNAIGFIWTSGEWVYSLVSLSGGLVVGFMLHERDRIHSFAVVGTGALAGLVMTIVATPLNMLLRDGMTGNAWGDALVEMVGGSIQLSLFCCILGELIVIIPDKVFTMALLWAILYLFRKSGIHLIADEESEEDKNFDDTEHRSLMGIALAVILSAAFCAIIPAGRVQAGSFDSDYTRFIYGVEDGLNSSEINAIAQSGDGYIWVGAYSGLYRYNGTSFEKILLDERISNAMVLYTDLKGRLWIGTNDNGVACYNPDMGQLRFFTMVDGLCSNSIRGILQADDGNFYICTSTYICRLSARGGIFEDEYGDLPEVEIEVYDDLTDITYVNDLSEAEDGMLCGVTESGLFFILKDGEILASKKCDDVFNSYSTATYYKSRFFIVGTMGNSMEYLRLTDDYSLVRTRTLRFPDLSCITDMLFLPKSNGLYIACENGIGFVSTGGMFQNLTFEDFSSAISDVLIDKQGNIWFTSSKQGVMKLSANPFTNLFQRAGIESSAVNSILIHDDVVYVGTDTGAVSFSLLSKHVIENEITARLKNLRIRHISADSKGNLWYSTYNSEGLVRVTRTGDVRYFNSINSGVLGNRFRFAIELSDGRIMAASSDGLSFIDGDEVVATIGEENGLTVPKVLCAEEESDGRIWIGTDGGGVYVIQGEGVTEHWGQDKGLQSQVIMKIVPCEGGRIFVASNGLYYHRDGQKVRKLANFPYTNNYDVYIAEDHTAFVCSSAGIYVMKESDLLADQEGYAYSLLNQKRGLNTTLTANAWNAVYGHNMYLCCTDGVRVLDLNNYDNFDTHYQIVVRNVTKDGETIRNTNGVYLLPSGRGQVQITPAVLNYTVSDPLVSVQLEGVDPSPYIMRQSELDTLYYSNIPYGNYSLRVKILDDTGTITFKEKIFLIQKDAKLYEYTYYKVYLFLIIAIMIAFMTWGVARMGNMAVINRQYDQIREAKEDAEYANQAKSRFLAQMSHEIRTPINAVLGMDEMILRETTDSEIRGYATDIYTAGQTLLSLINDILDSSKIESGKMEIVPVEYDLATLVRDLVNMISQRAQAKDLKLVVEVDPKLPKTLFGDDVRLRQVITNMLTNAVKYTVTGTVWLRMKGERLGEHCNLHVEVEDTGIGIKEEDLPKLFEEYQRIEEDRNRKVEGTGLGMNITVQLLHMMNSRLEVSSVYGKGSKFYFDILQEIIDSAPMGDYEKVANVAGLQMDDDQFKAPDAKVLVVDDNSMNRKVFRSLLRSTGIQITEAASGEESLNIVTRERFHLIFMDHMMPGMDGIETMKRMREMDACMNVPIYVLTANAVTGARDEYLARGFNGFLTKPIATDKLMEALREALPAELIRPLTEEEKLQAKAGDQRGYNPVPDDLPDVEGLDWSYAWLHLPEMDMLRDGVTSFYEIIGLQADRLQELYDAMLPKVGNVSAVKLGSDGESDQDNPLAAYRIHVHGMKSAAATIGIVPLAGMAKMLEFAAKDGNMKVIHSLHDTFLKEWRSYEVKLSGVFGLGYDRRDGEDAPEAESGDAELLQTMIDMLRPALEDLDVDTADDIMAKMKDYSFGEGVDALIPKLNAAVKNLDEELAGQIMDDMLKNLEK
jgi:signal transduction histidine kinase/DNA-binding NarL/FixJ family response regulator/sugar lactone lactonase YvrE/uncharacterized membrane protein